jgi:serine/threonine protein kinase/tetratricopeptide (TPR) repeat protein
MPLNENQARVLFLSALERDAGERSAYLDLACGADTELRARVGELLLAHAALGTIQGGPEPAANDVDADAVTEGPGTFIGPYRLLEKIGEGGFGIVYMAEQTEPVRRKVALKILKPGMDTRQVVARFEAERQALALMDHPNIAQVFDGGASPIGRPYFVMELVRGTPITTFCDQNLLSVRQRLALFVTVCHAVQHAHQKGIIHRDLKPSNVMVTLHDDKQVIKVIDFGIAKAVGQQLTEKTLFTNFAQMIGTPPYMSPEQAQMSGLDVDTRSDIYAMGVLLYELLTGTTPFDCERLRTVAFDEIRRIIREEEPPRPSTRLSDLNQAATTASTRRRSDPRRLSQAIRGELDWIVMKCLEKERSRRYETANSLATDLMRYLDNEPVQACPPSVAYRMRVFARRHRKGLMTAALLLAITALGGAMTAWQAIRAASAREAAVQARLALSAANQSAAEERADTVARYLESVNTANALIESGRVHASFGEWAEAEADLSSAVRIRPDHSSGWLTRGDRYARLGLWDMAAADFQRAYELQEPMTVSALHPHALLRFYVGDLAAYRRICARMAARFDRPTDPRVCDELVRACLLADDSVLGPDRLVHLAQSVASAAPSVLHLVGLGTAYYRAGQYETALGRLYEAKASVGDPRWDSTWADSMMAMAHYRLGRPDLARKDLESASAALGRRFVIQSGVSSSDANPSWWYDAHADLAFREATALIEGPNRPDDPRQWLNRGNALFALGRNEEAVASFGRSIEARKNFAPGYARRAETYGRLGQWEKALKDFEHLQSMQPERADANNELAWALATCPDVKYRDPVRSVALAEKAVALASLEATYWNTLGVARYRVGDWPGSVKAALKSMELSRAADVSDWFVLAMAQWRLEQKTRARRLCAHASRRMRGAAKANDQLLRFQSEAVALIGPNEASQAEPVAESSEDPSMYTLLLETDPDASWAYRQRGNVCASLKEWDQAAADFTRATARKPDNPAIWYESAAARLGAGDESGYRRVRAEMLQRFARTKHPQTANTVLYIAVALPAATGEVETMLPLGDLTLAAAPGMPRLRGAVRYRAGQFDAAIRDLNESSKVFPFRAWDWLFLAMAQQQLGKTADAKQSLAKAEEWIERANKNRLAGSGLPWISWHEAVEVDYILREANELIR